MSTLTKSLMGDYSNAISQFQFACLGNYSGPSMPMNLLGELVGAVDGIAPENLVKNTVAAVGGNRPKGGGAGLAGYLQQDDSEVAQGAMREHLCGVQEDFDIDRQDAAHLTSSARQCSGAIADVVDVSDTALTELISAVIPLLNILSMVATKHPLARFIIPILSTIGGRVIEETNHNIASTCRDRDDAIESCYNEFESRCECVCERPMPEECPTPAKPTDDACPAPVEQCPETPTPTKPVPKEECPPPPLQPTEPAQVECPPEPKPEPEPDSKRESSQITSAPPQPTPPSASPVPPEECSEPESSAKTEVHTETTGEHGLGCHCNQCTEQPFTERPSLSQRDVEITRPAQAEIIPPQEPPEQPQPVEEPCPEPEPQPERKPKPDMDTEPASESGAGEETLCPENTAESTEECLETTQTSSEGCEIESSCSGSLGMVGAGIALVGVGLIVEGAAQCLETMSEADCPVQEPESDPVPEPEPEPEPDPCPEPKPEPEQEPEPCPEPDPTGDDGVMAPPPELSQVEEPTPLAEKVAHLPADGPAEAPAPSPAPAPAPEPTPAPAPQPAPEEAPAPAPAPHQEAAPAPEEPTIKARKAGQW